MNSRTIRRHRITWFLALVTWILMASAVQGGQYNIVIDRSENMVSGGGTGFNGGTWYQYPDGSYIQWFPNGFYDPDRVGYYSLQAFITTPDQKRGVISYELGICYTTPDWDTSNPNLPPLPDVVLTANEQFKYIYTQSIHSNENIFIGSNATSEIPSIEPREEGYAAYYNPGWMGVSISGSNISVHRTLYVDCLDSTDDVPGDPDDDDDDSTDPSGVCCNIQTGSYFQGTAANCGAPFVWLGEGSTAADCDPDFFLWDFGDAPASYKVYKADEGARHYISEQMFLGLGLSADRNGQPSTAANIDQNDDGVTFTSNLMIGNSTVLNIVASQPGVVSAWIDLNQDGDWDDAEERRLVDHPVNPGTNAVAIAIPAQALPGQTYARFRYSSQTGLNYFGQAPDGEVEDYLVTITTNNNPGNGGSTPPPITALTAQSPKNTYVPRWTQTSDFTSPGSMRLRGWAEPSLYHGHPVVADDWIANKSDPITGLRWWGVFDGWNLASPPTNLPSAFHVAVWSDPINAGVPSEVVWESLINSWSWTLSGFTEDPDGTLSNQSIFEFGALLSQDQWFQPTPHISEHYWLSISAVYTATANQNPWGWLTREHHHGSAAVRIYQVAGGQSGQSGQWPPTLGDLAVLPQPIEKPIGSGTPWDVTFELMTKAEMGGDGTFVVSADMNGDGVVSIQDLEMLTALWMAAVE